MQHVKETETKKRIVPAGFEEVGGYAFFICVNDVTRFIIFPESNRRVKIALPLEKYTHTGKCHATGDWSFLITLQ